MSYSRGLQIIAHRPNSAHLLSQIMVYQNIVTPINLHPYYERDFHAMIAELSSCNRRLGRHGLKYSLDDLYRKALLTLFLQSPALAYFCDLVSYHPPPYSLCCHPSAFFLVLESAKFFAT